MDPLTFQSVMEGANSKYLLAKVIKTYTILLVVEYYILVPVCDTALLIFLFYAFHTQDMLAEIPFQVTEYMKDRNFTPNVPDVSMATKFQDMTLGF